MLKMIAIMQGIAIVVFLGVVFLMNHPDTVEKEVAPEVPATLELQGDIIIPEYVESVHQQSDQCAHLVALSQQQDRLLEECLALAKRCCKPDGGH